MILHIIKYSIHAKVTIASLYEQRRSFHKEFTNEVSNSHNICGIQKIRKRRLWIFQKFRISAIKGSNPIERKYFNVLLLKSQGKSRIIKQKSLNEKFEKNPLSGIRILIS